jgi:ATP-dependent Clp protease protease subunit
MSDTIRTLNTIGVWLLALAFLALAVFQGALFFWLATAPDEGHDPEMLLESFIDNQIEAGFAFPELDDDDPLLAARKILLDTEVNERIAHDVVGRLFHLNELDPERPIQLYISTHGGWSHSAFTIVDAMRLIDAPVNTWAIGGAYSSGAVVLTAGTGRRYATPNAILMVHTNMADSSEPFSYERLEKARYERIFRETADLPDDWYPMTSGNAYYVTAEEALELGMIDEIADGP